MFNAHIVVVSIAAPGDPGQFSTAVEQALGRWNHDHAEQQRIVLIPQAGHHSADHGQPGRASDRCDMVIGLLPPTPTDAVHTDLMADLVHANHAGIVTQAWALTNTTGPECRNRLADTATRLAAAGMALRYTNGADVADQIDAAISADLSEERLSSLTARFESTEQARRVTTYRQPLRLAGPGIWAVSVHNESTGLVTGVAITVDAVDSGGNVAPGAVKRSRQTIADEEFFKTVRTSRWPGGNICQPGRPASAPPSIPASGMELLSAHTAESFPRWLRPDQHSCALYALAPGLSPHVRIEYEDQAGLRWSRTNDEEPEQISLSAAPIRG